MRTYSEFEVAQIINKVTKIFDNTEGIRERGIYLTANICIDEEGAMLLMVDIRTASGILDVRSPLHQKIRISELLENETKDNIITTEIELDLSIQSDCSGSLDYIMEGYERRTKTNIKEGEEQ